MVVYGLVFASIVSLFCAIYVLICNENENIEVTNNSNNLVSNIEENLENDTMSLEYGMSIGTNASYVENGVRYIGIVYIPKLDNLASPIIDECTNSNLKISSCRFSGSIKNNNMTIAGHNFKSLFGQLNKLSIGDTIYFKDLESNLYKYELKQIETLEPYEVDKMENTKYNLTLFTCNYTNTKRIAYRCDLINVEK